MKCVYCTGTKVVKNGSNSVGTPKYLCRSCGRQFVEQPKKQAIKEETKDLIKKLLLERLSLAGIARVTGVSEKWLQDYVNKLYEQTPRELQLREKKQTTQ
jgi:insertion element IS1 protein InsB